MSGSGGEADGAGHVGTDVWGWISARLGAGKRLLGQGHRFISKDCPQGRIWSWGMIVGSCPSSVTVDVVRSLHLQVVSFLKSGGIVVGTWKCQGSAL